MNDLITTHSKYVTRIINSGLTMLVEVRHWSQPPSFDKSIRYDITFIQGTREYEFKDLDYTGVKYKVK